MALWMVRAGRYGEYEDRFLADSRIYLTWDTFNSDLRSVGSRAEIGQMLREAWVNATEGKVRNHAGQDLVISEGYGAGGSSSGSE